MELHYRGAVYKTPSVAVEMTDAETVGHYRGVSFRLRQPKRPAVQESVKYHLKYRGAWIN